MILYILFRIGHFLAMSMPVKAGYAFAEFVANAYALFSKKDRAAVRSNLNVILGNTVSENDLDRMSLEVFKNFAKYLVDFFRFSKIDAEYIARYVKIEGLHNIDHALSRGKGVIVLSAHIGNWELGGAVISTIGYQLSGVVLTHQNKMINNFFTKQRLIGKMQPIEMGMTLKSCYKLLKNNQLLAILGDRNFTNNGVTAQFFGRTGRFPKGPASFSYRIGTPIVPAFMVRQPDDTFKLFIDEPIFFTAEDIPEEEAVKNLSQKCVSVIESYVRRYPTQWYIFKEIGKEEDVKSVRRNTLV